MTCGGAQHLHSAFQIMWWSYFSVKQEVVQTENRVLPLRLKALNRNFNDRQLLSGFVYCGYGLNANLLA